VEEKMKSRNIHHQPQRCKDTKKTRNSDISHDCYPDQKPWREPIPASVDRVAKEVVDAAFRVHSLLGSGLFESVYEVCMEYELKK
jgi:hypothetical protein